MSVEDGVRKLVSNSNAKLWLVLVCIVAGAFMVSTVVLAVFLGLQVGGGDAAQKKLPAWPTVSEGYMGNFTKAAVAADNGICSEIGRNILVRGGNAVDSVIATVFCIGVMDAHSSGIGGGHLMTIYNSSTRQCLIIDARERAPLASNENLYVNRSKASQLGWLAVGVPGEVHGLHTAFKLAGSGKVNWSDLVMPTVDLCRFGFPVSGALAKALANQKEAIFNESTLRSIFINNETGKLYETGDIMRRPTLAVTLENLANAADPIQWFYNSSITDKMADEFKQNRGIITAEDFHTYKSRHGENRRPIYANLGSNLVACGPPPPSSAAVTLAILNIMQGYNITQDNLRSFDFQVDTFHRLLEAMKYSYGARSLLGDMDFVDGAEAIARNITSPEFGAYIRGLITNRAHLNASDYFLEHYYVPPDHGTAHISVMDEQGNAVAVTSTVNLYFGARVRSLSTGIIWNDEMDDFSTPGAANYFGYAPSRANLIQPGKRPLSSMSPIVVFDEKTGQPKIVAGAAGGSRIITATAQLIMRILWFGQNVREAIEAPRLHNQLQPFYSEFENGFPKAYLEKLIERGQNFTTLGSFSTAATAISVGDDSRIYANSDYRKAGGYPSGY